jgi:hypothetical protein
MERRHVANLKLMISPSSTTYSPVLAARGHRAARRECVIADHFGTNEAALNVAVNLTRRKLGGRAACDGPGAAFVFADREERHVAEQLIRRADDAIETRLAQAKIGEEGCGVSSIELSDFQLDLRAQRDGFRGRMRKKISQACLFSRPL